MQSHSWEKQVGDRTSLCVCLFFWLAVNTQMWKEIGGINSQPHFLSWLIGDFKTLKFILGQANMLLFPSNKAPHWLAQGTTESKGWSTRWRRQGLPCHRSAFARWPSGYNGTWIPCTSCHILLDCFGWESPSSGRGLCLKHRHFGHPASTLPFLPLNAMCSEHPLATKNKRTLFFLFIPNDKQRGSFIFSSHLINQTIPSLRWLRRGSLSSPVRSAQKPLKRCQARMQQEEPGQPPVRWRRAARPPLGLMLAAWCCFCEGKSGCNSDRLSGLDTDTSPECSHALCSSQAMHRCLWMPTFGAHFCGLEVLWKKDVVFHGCFVFPHDDLDWTGNELNGSVW